MLLISFKKTIERELKLAAKKAAKKYPIIFLCLVLVVAAVVIAYLYLIKDNNVSQFFLFCQKILLFFSLFSFSNSKLFSM